MTNVTFICKLIISDNTSIFFLYNKVVKLENAKGLFAAGYKIYMRCSILKIPTKSDANVYAG